MSCLFRTARRLSPLAQTFNHSSGSIFWTATSCRISTAAEESFPALAEALRVKAENNQALGKREVKISPGSCCSR